MTNQSFKENITLSTPMHHACVAYQSPIFLTFYSKTLKMERKERVLVRSCSHVKREAICNHQIYYCIHTKKVFSSKEGFFYHSYSWSWLKYSFEDNCTILTYGWLLVPSFNVSLSFSSNLIYIAYLISFILLWAFTILFPNKVLWFAFELFHFCFPKISASLKNLLVEKVCPGFFMFGPVQLGTMGSPGGTTHTFLTVSVLE